MSKVDVVIVGGGVAGGAAACAFSKHGLNVVLFERRDLTRDPNRGDALEVETVRALEAIGAREEMEQRGALWARQAIFLDAAGGGMLRAELGENARFVLNHAEIEASLLEVARRQGADIRLQTVTGVHHEGGRWRVQVGNELLEPKLLVAADGARSMIRQHARIEHPGNDYEHSVVILHAQRPEWMEEDMAWLIHHRQGAVMVLPTTPRGKCRLVVTVPRNEAAEWMREESSVLQERLAARTPRLADLVPERLGGAHIYQVARRHAPRYVDGQMVLVGDAAHVTHPMGGWGMNLAIRDAAALGELTAPALLQKEGEGELRRCLLEYERRQRPRNARTLRAAHLHSQLMAPGPFTYWLGKAIIGLFSSSKGPRKMPLMR